MRLDGDAGGQRSQGGANGQAHAGDVERGDATMPVCGIELVRSLALSGVFA